MILIRCIIGFISCLQIRNTVLCNSTLYHYNAIYWDVKPYYFIDPKTGNRTGILQDLIQRANYYCADGFSANFDHVANFSLPMKEASDLTSLFHSSTEYGTGLLTGLTKENTIWFPYFRYIEGEDLSSFEKRNAVHLELTSIPSVVVVRKSWRILLEYKFLIGLYKCRILFVLIFLLSIIVSIITWLFERNINNEISSTLIKGVADSYWMNTVTLVTVGYGDVSPKSPVTKLMMIGWMFLGLFYAALLTATLLDAITEDNVKMLKYDKNVAIVDNSFEKKLIESNYNPNIIPTKSNEDAVAMVRDGTADSAVMNSWTAAWYQDEIVQHDFHHQLSIVGEIKVNIPLMIIFSAPKNESYGLWQCMRQRWDEIVKYSFNKYERKVHIESTKLVTFEESAHLIPHQGVVILTFIAIVIALSVYYIERLKTRKVRNVEEGERNSAEGERRVDIERQKETKLKPIPLSIIW